MKSRKDVNSADIALTVRNTMWALPYLVVLGIFWGFLAGEFLGALAGLLAAAAASAVIGSATTVFTGIVGGGAVTKSWSDDIGADGYAENAYGAVELAKSFTKP